MHSNELFKPLEMTSVGRNLKAEDLVRLQQLAHIVELGKGDYLLRQHCQAKQTYCVAEGSLIVERITMSGRRQVVAFLYPGDFLGLTNTNFIEFSAVSMTAAKVWSFPRRGLFELANQSPQLKQNLDWIGNQVLSRALDQLFALGQKKAHERICFLFNQLIERQPGALAENLNLPMTRQDIADYLGLTIETVSRGFAKLKEMGIIQVDHINHVEIVDVAQMEELASAE